MAVTVVVRKGYIERRMKTYELRGRKEDGMYGRLSTTVDWV